MVCSARANRVSPRPPPAGCRRSRRRGRPARTRSGRPRRRAEGRRCRRRRPRGPGAAPPRRPRTPCRLTANAGRLVTTRQILDHVWEYDFGGNDGVVQTYISYLRRKVDACGPPLARTVPRVGYTLRLPRED
ncbi:helix-turn-helix domain-containing protein [Planomonospora alba]|uniref:helix-turn-helix domain-containing protein n=1 Tax=Planomonospora alba TaxID=161354 RepID=UPI0031EB5E28